MLTLQDSRTCGGYAAARGGGLNSYDPSGILKNGILQQTSTSAKKKTECEPHLPAVEFKRVLGRVHPPKTLIHLKTAVRPQSLREEKGKRLVLR